MNFIALTVAENGETSLINLDRVFEISPIDGGTVLKFDFLMPNKNRPGMTIAQQIVKESMVEILSLLTKSKENHQ